MKANAILNDVPFGSKDYRVYCEDEAGIDLIDMQKRRIDKLKISLNGFFADTYKDHSYLYAQSISSRGVYYPVLITLTYETQEMWDARDISKLVDYYRKDWKQRLGRESSTFRYLWVAEMQKRGVIHYHLVLWCPRGKTLAKPDKAGWKKGRTNISAVKKGVMGYLSKYLSKGSCAADFKGKKVYFPKGARIFGFGGLSLAAKKKIAFSKLPRYVRDYFKEEGERISKVKGGYKKGTEELMSPYEFQVVKMSPVSCPYSASGWVGGNLTCIIITYQRKWVMLNEKEAYLNEERDNGV